MGLIGSEIGFEGASAVCFGVAGSTGRPNMSVSCQKAEIGAIAFRKLFNPRAAGQRRGFKMMLSILALFRG